MTPTRAKIHIAFWLSLLCLPAGAAQPLDDRMAAARTAIERASALPMGGPAAEMLGVARERMQLADAAAAARKARLAIQHAGEAEAAADLAAARFRYNFQRYEVESRTSRNTELRRKLLVQPAGPGR
jgi:hypothetical protein